jgi:2-dehydro-3-deoxyphosphogluconate aldolase / (4S)-4-hydroxy-2-oxoglutarate aldolase
LSTEILRRHPTIAVIRARDMELALAMAVAVAKGGVEAIEVTANSDRPWETIAKLREILPDCWIGAGTVVSLSDLHEAIAAGAEYAFSPHVDAKLIETAIAREIAAIPGALTPTEAMAAWRLGATAVKIFPVNCVGGVEYIKALRAPLPDIPLIPTGGVGIDNAAAYLRAGAIAIGIAGDLFPAEAIAARNWEAITDRAKLLTNSIVQSP